MTDPQSLVTLTGAAVAALAIATGAALRGWNQWLDLKRLESGDARGATPGGGEIGELRRRVRRLEAIANGVEP